MSDDNKEVTTEVVDVYEESDGTAVVELADGSDEPTRDSDSSDSADDRDSGADSSSDTEAIREARRARRRAKKEYIKRSNEEKDSRIVQLSRQNQELMERISAIERKSHTADLARLDSAITDEEGKLEFFRRKMQEATDSSDGAAFIKAQEAWYDTRRRVEAMHNIKTKAVQASNKPEGAADPTLAKLANDWMRRNPWYDPRGDDEDSAIAKVVDTKLAAEGWDPRTQEYWKEFDKRLRARLPNRYTEDHDDRPQRRPRTVVTGSSRESDGGSSSSNSIVFSAEHVRNLKEAGLWDNEATRKKMARIYAENERKNRG